MDSSVVLISGIAAILGVALIFTTWRWTSRIWSLPCPSLFGWALESKFYAWLVGTETTLQRIGFQLGQRVLEIGPGPGRLLIPAAQRIGPSGEAVGIDVQRGMIERLTKRAKSVNISNLTAILGDATQPIVPEASFDVVFLVTTLGEIPDRKAALHQCFRALKSGGILSVTELLVDPHYQSRNTVKRLAEEAGFHLETIQGNAGLFTAKFSKP